MPNCVYRVFHIRYARLCIQSVPHKVCQTVYTECSTWGVPNCVYRVFHMRCAKQCVQSVPHDVCQTVYTECSAWGVPNFRILLYESYWVKKNCMLTCAWLSTVTVASIWKFYDTYVLWYSTVQMKKKATYQIRPQEEDTHKAVAYFVYNMKRLCTMTEEYEFLVISPSYFLCFVDRASRYNCIEKTQLDAQLILSIFRQPLHVSGISRPIIGR
jgi:hypothetical protein